MRHTDESTLRMFVDDAPDAEDYCYAVANTVSGEIVTVGWRPE